MEQILLYILFFGVLVGGSSAFMVYAFISIIKHYKPDTKTTDPEDTSAEPVYETVKTKATVINQACFVRTVGYKTPKTMRVFTVTFQTETGKILELNVPEEMYDGFEQGQTGILTVIDGELYGFELDETATPKDTLE